ncbi:hypothetical protein CNMCM6936_007035 [Aspergillus lentulus]|nr:hypothetical protein CNMCM6936_007035 [Aspergillus lentulus]KAF4175493.1 hypothetical protein CNMCM8060_007214 [Aspergillus lentulus]KAF4186653.1 hypothetical protein CNMCM7927_005197 [Aspergillus lentulus]KAF4196856.1 hypothetical protein CNMCM8694_004351 [Aspergillus lentulus]
MRAPISLLCLFAQTSCLLCLWPSFALIQGVAASRHDPLGLVYEAAAPPPLGKRQDLQSFAGALGGAAPAVTSTGDSERPYGVSGNTFISSRLLNGAATSNLIPAKKYILSIAKTGWLLSLTGLDIDREYRPIGVILAAGLSGSVKKLHVSINGAGHGG